MRCHPYMPHKYVYIYIYIYTYKYIKVYTCVNIRFKEEVKQKKDNGGCSGNRVNETVRHEMTRKDEFVISLAFSLYTILPIICFLFHLCDSPKQHRFYFLSLANIYAWVEVALHLFIFALLYLFARLYACVCLCVFSLLLFVSVLLRIYDAFLLR
ncbi:hypothetical protein, unlikely [Trypanosoma brucei gambiense DAL972]|uniref:Uncharacterized protein n=1 Tax=Trypanosoma brucei gambiense (strain MHOM/CI/86/DAL972) TaxID=679716 RepID=C9ZK37_TRYB9|nr:hypothetical protein, unlikely [Trypanosoma brucei gambiense DAL972]CBH09801.1 hypothetical protein, unlikely [Trypanosoma brucei gambiense DAL972]|eukprot:XP_011772094.1 hypothetical protein, unlikely [Trypanosoma brucei gambiense DAL972]